MRSCRTTCLEYEIRISKYKTEESNASDSREFGIIQSASLRARIQTVRSKAKSLVRSHTNDPQEIKKIINGIRWEFLDFKTPEELAVEVKKNTE